MRATYANTSLHNTSRFARRPEFAHVSPSTCRAVRYFLSRKDIGIGSNGRLSPSLSLSVSAGLTSFLRNGSRQEIVDRLPIVAREIRPLFNKFPKMSRSMEIQCYHQRRVSKQVVSRSFSSRMYTSFTTLTLKRPSVHSK